MNSARVPSQGDSLAHGLHRLTVRCDEAEMKSGCGGSGRRRTCAVGGRRQTCKN
jgi:hypothetical protein